MEDKKCTICNEIKSIKEFNYKDKKTGRRQSKCRSCHSIYLKKTL